MSRLLFLLERVYRVLSSLPVSERGKNPGQRRIVSDDPTLSRREDRSWLDFNSETLRLGENRDAEQRKERQARWVVWLFWASIRDRAHSQCSHSKKSRIVLTPSLRFLVGWLLPVGSGGKVRMRVWSDLSWAQVWGGWEWSGTKDCLLWHPDSHCDSSAQVCPQLPRNEMSDRAFKH